MQVATTNSGMNIGPPDEDGEDTKMITDRIICKIHHALKQAKEKEENEEVDKKKEPIYYHFPYGL